MKQLITDMTGLIGFGLLTAGVYLYAGLPASLMLSGCLLLLYALVVSMSKRLVRTVLIFTESSDQLSRATDRVPGLPASPGYVQ
ncbi:hypothetical protein AB9C32_22180, partial [Escherichia coli]